MLVHLLVASIQNKHYTYHQQKCEGKYFDGGVVVWADLGTIWFVSESHGSHLPTPAE